MVSSPMSSWTVRMGGAGDRDKIGAPRMSDKATDPGVKCNFISIPWSQPLREIREYFGEQVAMYFAWLGFYGLKLIIPAAGFGLLYISENKCTTLCSNGGQVFWR